MITKKLRVAGEIVSHCRKCNLDLNHIIVALVGNVPKRVKCLTCQTEHAYHKPQEERDRDARLERSASPAARVVQTAIRSNSARALAQMQADNARERDWQKRLAGQVASAFVSYSPRGTFKLDQLIRHAKFGDGFVVRIIDANKIEVMFQEGTRTLAQGVGG